MPDFAKILDNIKNDLLAQTDIETFAAGTIARELVNAYSSEVSSMYDLLDTKFNQSLISEAVGEYLDQLGLLVGMVRNTSARAYGNVTFSIDTSFGKDIDDIEELAGGPVVFPAGTYVSDENGTKIYSTTESVTISDSPVSVVVVANANGSNSNVGPGELSRYILPSNTTLQNIVDYVIVSNSTVIDSGSDVESDDDYRFRIINAFQDSAKANKIAVKLAALSVPGVIDAYVTNFYNGIGTFNVSIVSESPIASEGILAAAQEAVNQVTAAGIRATVDAPEYEAAHMKIVVSFKRTATDGDKSTITNNINSVIVDLINNLDIGSPLIVNNVIATAFAVSDLIQNVEIIQFGRGTYNSTTGTIDDYEPLVLSDQSIDFATKWVTNKKLLEVCCVR